MPNCKSVKKKKTCKREKFKGLISFYVRESPPAVEASYGCV